MSQTCKRLAETQPREESARQTAGAATLTGDETVASWRHEPTRVCLVGLPLEVLKTMRESRLDDGAITVHVLGDGAAIAASDALPSVAGRCELGVDSITFLPHFPLEQGLNYRATFHGGASQPAASRTLVSSFSFAKQMVVEQETEVEAVYPTANVLPENVFRFYVRFSSPMRRGGTRGAIMLRDESGAPVFDALYRAPVELWSRDMRTLTVLLDPGRLKRRVGPNAALGPPLQQGKSYTLEIAPGLIDCFGRQFRQPTRKHFHVTSPERRRIDVMPWEITSPAANSLDSLRISFRRPLDWVLLQHGLSIRSDTLGSIHGLPEIGAQETSYNFHPAETWRSGAYRVYLSSRLEDVSGNSLFSAFDGPLQQEPERAEMTAQSKTFVIA